MNWHCRLTKHKVFEIQLDYFKEGNWFDFSISWSKKTDHAGLRFYLEILHVFLEIQIYDCRHWDFENNKYVG